MACAYHSIQQSLHGRSPHHRPNPTSLPHPPRDRLMARAVGLPGLSEITCQITRCIRCDTLCWMKHHAATLLLTENSGLPAFGALQPTVVEDWAGHVQA